MNAVILAGGTSSRMGRDKAGLMIEDETLLDRTARLLIPLCEKVYVSLRPDQALPQSAQPLSRIDDLHENIGPLSGVLSAFATHPDTPWLVVSCDLPRLDASTLERLVGQYVPGTPVTCYNNPGDQLPEPLCAIYDPLSYPVLQQHRRKGELSLRKIIGELHTSRLELEGSIALNDVNKPDEYDKVREIQ